MHRLEQCPSCGHGTMHAAFPGHERDNSLARLVGKQLPFPLPGFDLKAHATSDWSVCDHCALMFARNRPQVEGLEQWYPPLFQYSEERNYNTAALPEAYLESKARGAKVLFELLQTQGVFKNAKSLLHFRTGPGHLLMEAQKAMPHLQVYGLEYFKHPADYARKLVGEERIAVINVPEPIQPFAVKQFDVLVVNHFLTHAHDPRAFLRYLRSILADDGRLVFYNEQDHDLSLKSMTAYPRGINFFHKQLFTRQSLRAMVSSAGFAVTEVGAAKSGRQPKYVTLLCQKSEATKVEKVDAQAALKRLRKWRRLHRLYRFGKPIIDPVRKLLG